MKNIQTFALGMLSGILVIACGGSADSGAAAGPQTVKIDPTQLQQIIGYNAMLTCHQVAINAGISYKDHCEQMSKSVLNQFDMISYSPAHELPRKRSSSNGL